MNILLWILQGMLAFWNVTGGIYTMKHHEQIKGGLGNNLPPSAWVTLSVLQILFALCLVVPGVIGVLPKLTAIAAAYLALNSLSGLALAAKYAGFPGMLWGVIPAILAAFVAYGRMQS